MVSAMNILQRASFRYGARHILRNTRKRTLQCARRNNSAKELEKPPHTPNEIEVKEPVDVPQPIWYHRLGPVTDFFGWFHKLQGRRPLTVQISTTLVTYFCGDILAQDIGGEKYDPHRTMRMLLIGAIASVPGYKWFLFLGNHFNYASRWGSVLVKVCVQQAVFTPVFNTYFFGMQAIMTGSSPFGVIERVKNTVPTSMWNSLKLWPAVTAFSFAFVMPQYRFMLSGVFAVGWQAYLSFLNRREEKVDRDTIRREEYVSKVQELAQQTGTKQSQPSGS